MMRISFAVAVTAAAGILLVQPTSGQSTPEELGEVHFSVSCNPDAQRRFDRAVSILHSFWYEEAVKGFKTVIEADPSCSMGYWGIAMSNWYQLWYPPNPAHLKEGLTAIQQAESAVAKTERERDYIRALEAFYRDSDKIDHRTRSLGYEKAMEQVYLRYPDDREAAIFYALALNATALLTDKTYVNQRKAAAILEPILAQQSNHPGVAHYLIHSYDSERLAEHGLPAARRYAQIAPSVPHALHMPSHIFTRLGLWQEDINSNRHAADAGIAYARATFGPGVGWDQALHAMDYLEYAYLQVAQDREAKQVRDSLVALQKVTPEGLAAAYAIAAIPARFALERRNWPEAVALSAPPFVFPWDRFPHMLAITSFARALGAARTGDIATAQNEVERLQSLHQALLERRDVYWADQVEVQRLGAAGALARAEGKDDEAVRLTRAAADLDGTMDKLNVTPAEVLPARELLADLLLDVNQPAEALSEYERSLGMEPKRFRSLVGAARAAKMSGDADKARAFYAQIVDSCSSATTERPELVEARAFVTR